MDARGPANVVRMDDSALEAAHAALTSMGVLVPVRLGGFEEERWANCDLASLAGNRLGEEMDPARLDRRTRKRWLATAVEERLCTPSERKSEACYWIVRGGTEVGTLALTRFCLGHFSTAYSVYLRPPWRGRGIMAATLRVVYSQLEARGLGLQLDTPWTWQHAVRFYLRNGFWLSSWKRDLTFVRRPLVPPPILRMTARSASIDLELEGQTITLARAHRDDDKLLEHAVTSDGPEWLDQTLCDAPTTLALCLALHGWPLVRLGLLWRQARYSDCVHPEALAERIVFWEAWTANHGWRIDTPRIPGLEYPTWAELDSVTP
jgi:GNAT superfamily N-acetyltransferase